MKELLKLSGCFLNDKIINCLVFKRKKKTKHKTNMFDYWNILKKDIFEFEFQNINA